MKKKELKMIRKEVRKHLDANQAMHLQFVSGKLDLMPKPWYLPQFLWNKIKTLIIVEFGSDTIQKI